MTNYNITWSSNNIYIPKFKPQVTRVHTRHLHNHKCIPKFTSHISQHKSLECTQGISITTSAYIPKFKIVTTSQHKSCT